MKNYDSKESVKRKVISHIKSANFTELTIKMQAEHLITYAWASDKDIKTLLEWLESDFDSIYSERLSYER